MRFFAGIVLYNPDPRRLLLSLNSIVQQVEHVILIDNASDNVDGVSSLLSKYQNVSLIKNEENLGIAAALNQICKTAYNSGANWVLTLDQDTVCPSDIISELATHCDDNSIGIICPAVNYEGLNINKNNGGEVTINKNNGGEVTTSVGACMTSGSLTNLKAWNKVGGFREDYFIDFVDNEFCMKLHISNFNIIRVNGCIMNHQLGVACEKRVLGVFKRKVCIHSPWRFYYMTRNNLIFIWQYKSRLNIIKEYLKLGSILWNGVFYADEKEETCRYIKKGITDARQHRMGKLKM